MRSKPLPNVPPPTDGVPMGPVSIVKVRLVGAIGGHIIVEWVLTTPPDGVWIDAFDRARPTRRGTPVFLLGGSGSPKVRDDGTIRWSVPHSDLGAAASFVMESVVSANAARADWAHAGAVHAGPTRAGSRPVGGPAPPARR